MTGEFAIAVHALVYLTQKATTVSSASLAGNVCTNPARIRKVMVKLKKAGIVVTKEGTDGGYLFQKDPASVSLRQVIDAVEIPIVTSTWRSVDSNSACKGATEMAHVMDDIYAELDDFCREKLEQMTILDIEQRLVEYMKE